MSKIIFFHVPEFFAPLEFFFGLLNSDIWVVLDHVTFLPRSRQSRCRVKKVDGIRQLPVAVKRPCSKPFCNMVIDNSQSWRRLFLKAMREDYGVSPFFREYFDDVKYFVESPHVLLENINMQTTAWAAEAMGKQMRCVYSKNYYTDTPVSEVIPQLLNKLDGELFSYVFEHPVYQQRTEPFESELSVLDSFFNVGAQETKRMLMEVKPCLKRSVQDAETEY
jgi:hypothetical protein